VEGTMRNMIILIVATGLLPATDDAPVFVISNAV
jgi:hypothetical protein